MQVEGEVSRSEAIRRAIEDYLKRRRIEKFMDLAGSGLVDMDRRQAETAEVQKATRCGRKP
jgi:metal-responsive CopG/Arc/MetJ family transcriptional regulator